MLRASSKAWRNVASLLKGAQKNHLIHCTICYQTAHLFIGVISLFLLCCFLPPPALLGSETVENVCSLLFGVETLAV